MTNPNAPSTKALTRREALAGLLLLPGIALSGCGGSGGTASSPAITPTPTPSSATLTTVNGINAVSSTPGADRDVFADADPSGMVFDQWTGDRAALLTPTERRSGTVVSAQATPTVTAVFKPLAEFTPQTTVLNGLAPGNADAVNGYWFFPNAKPRGVIFRFHGSGGSGAAQFDKTEERKFPRDAVGSGFAVVSLDSNNRLTRMWNAVTDPANPAANGDVQNIQQFIADLTAQGLINAATPFFASGHSDGAGAALRFAFLMGWKASHQSCVPGLVVIAQATTVPGIWTMAQNDTRDDPQRNAKALTNANALAARQVPSQYILVAPSAVYPTRFTQIVGIGATDSLVIYNIIKAAGRLDAHDFQTTDPNEVDYAKIVPPVYAGFAKDIGDQLNVAFAAHQFSAATNRRVLDFFIAQI